MPTGRKPENLIGRKFTKLLVLEIDRTHKNGRVRWKCQCDCGQICIVIASKLKNGFKKSCGCSSTKMKGKANPQFSGYEGISGSYWCVVRNNAKSRNIKLNISIQDAWNQFVKQNGKCAISGIDIYICPSNIEILKNKDFYNASLDRIDSSKNYTIDNIQWVDKTINMLKFNFKEEKFFHICKIITDFQSNKNLPEYII